VSEPEKKPSKWSKIIDKVIESTAMAVIASLVIGFFVIIWQTSSSIDQKLATLSKQQDDANHNLKASVDTLVLEVARLQTTTQHNAQLEKEIADLKADLQEMHKYVASIKQPNQAPPPALKMSTNPVQKKDVFTDVDAKRQAIENTINAKRGAK